MCTSSDDDDDDDDELEEWMLEYQPLRKRNDNGNTSTTTAQQPQINTDNDNDNDDDDDNTVIITMLQARARRFEPAGRIHAQFTDLTAVSELGWHVLRKRIRSRAGHTTKLVPDGYVPCRIASPMAAHTFASNRRSRSRTSNYVGSQKTPHKSNNNNKRI
eukprot:scaffold2807_cov84-Amphora_coffeaeformis.AAC.1